MLKPLTMTNTMLLRILALFALAMALLGAMPPTQHHAPNHSFSKPLVPADYPYYFILNHQLRDVRDFRLVDDRIVADPETMVFYAEDKQSLLAGSHKSLRYSRYSLTGDLLHSFQLDPGEVIAPGWTHKIYLKDQDIWAVDLDWQTGQLVRPRQITQLGTFNPLYGIEFSHWYQDKIILWIEQTCYLLNTTDGRLQAMIPDESYCIQKMAPYLSPTGRYIFYKNHIIDLKKREARPIANPNVRAEFLYWQSNETVFMFSPVARAPLNIRREPPRNVILDMATGIDQQTFTVGFLAVNGMYHWQRQDQGQVSRYFSPSGKYLLYAETGKKPSGQPGSLPLSDIWIGDTQNHLNIATPIHIRHPLEQNFDFQWTSNGSFIYATKGDPLAQGTWFYDIHTQKKKKITPYIASQLTVLKQAGKMVFMANNHLYKVDLDGSNLKQLTAQPLNRWNQQLRRFLE